MSTITEELNRLQNNYERIDGLADEIAEALENAYVPEVTVEPLSVTENGAYTADEGKAFSPVTINVPTDKRVLYFTPSSDVPDVTLTHNLGAIPTHATVLATDPSPDGSAKLITGTTKEDGSPGRIYGYKPDGTEYIGNTGFYIDAATATSVRFRTISSIPFRANVEYCFVISA